MIISINAGKIPGCDTCIHSNICKFRERYEDYNRRLTSSWHALNAEKTMFEYDGFHCLQYRNDAMSYSSSSIRSDIM